MLPLIVAAVAAALAPGDFAAPAGAERFAAISLVNATRLPAGLEIAIGSATRRATPLFEQDRVWEPRLDNGYPNVVYDLAGAASPWLLWYGGCGSAMNCRHQFLLYANSSDGKKRPRPPPLPNKHTHTHTNTNTTPSILPRSRFLPAHGTSWVCPGLVWNKPSLGRYDASKYFPAIPKAQAKENNIVMYGGGLGMYKDHHEVDPSGTSGTSSLEGHRPAVTRATALATARSQPLRAPMASMTGRWFRSLPSPSRGGRTATQTCFTTRCWGST